MQTTTALVLAGRRGPEDPLARAQGVRHRALLEVGGVPMLLRVVRTLRASPAVGAIEISIDDPEALAAVPELAGWRASGELAVRRSLDSPSLSVGDALSALPAPLLVTTADHALLEPPVVEHFLAEAGAGGADLAVGMVTASLLRARFPETTRTWTRLGRESYSGANLFLFRTPQGARAAEFWSRAERFRKQPWRLVGVFGAGALLRFALRRLELPEALERVSRAMGARVEAVLLPFPEAAIDVDRLSDLLLANRILAER